MVGSGIRSVGQLTLEAVSWIETADVVCYVLADPVAERWVLEHSQRAEDLSRLHDTGHARLNSYATMAARLVDHARAGRTVVAVFYGHPGVFTSPTHWAIELAGQEGIEARMLPGVSAEDCLFADLGVDPGHGAFAAYEATEMLLTQRPPATDSHVVVWQVGVIAAASLATGSAATALVEFLLRFYPDDHQVTHYRAPQTAIGVALKQQVELGRLASLPLSVTSTLYVPPLTSRPIHEGEVAALNTGAMPEIDRPPTSFEQVRGLVGPCGSSDVDLPRPAWHRPLPPEPTRVEALLGALEDPATLTQYSRQPGLFLGAAGLDPIEMWACLARDEDWLAACIRYGSGPAAAVAIGVADTEQEARDFRIAADGRLVRKRRPAKG